MAKEIITDLEALHAPSEKIAFFDETGTHHEETDEIVGAIKAVMEERKDVIALSAPQIGIRKRAFCIRFGDEIKAFVDPIVTKKSDYKIAVETCASMPNKEILLARPEDITVVYNDANLKYEDNKLLGPAARLFEQQANLLDGVTPDELGLVSDINEDGPLTDLTEEELKQVIEIYKQFAEAKKKAIVDSLDDETDKAIYKHMKLTEDVITGRVEIMDNPADAKASGNRKQRRDASKMIKRQAAKLKQKKNAEKGGKR